MRSDLRRRHGSDGVSEIEIHVNEDGSAVIQTTVRGYGTQQVPVTASVAHDLALALRQVPPSKEAAA